MDHSGKKLIAIIILINAIYFAVPVSAEEECTSCHKIRHGLTGNFCDNCHYNTTLLNGKHAEKPFSPGFPHDSFDWEGDNANEKGPDRLNESCPVCHVSMLQHTSQTLNVCEDCHVEEVFNTNKLIAVRTDINKFIPRIFTHFNNSSINVPDQSDLGKTRSSCFGYDISTGEGSCHGVAYARKGSSGGFFSFNYMNYTGDVYSRGDPYHWNAPVDRMPDSRNCIFCHVQEDPFIRKAWGDPRPLLSDSSHINKQNKDCFNCHINGDFRSFHGNEVVRMADRSSIAGILTGSLLILTVIIIILWRKQR